MSPNTAQPLTLRTTPSDYATFNQIKSFLRYIIRLLLGREKQQKVFTAEQGWISAKIGNVVKNF